MNTPHPDPGELQAFSRHQLPPARRVAIDWHLSHCSQCRDDLAAIRPLARGRAPWDAVRRVEAHTSFEQLQGSIDGTLSAAQQQVVDDHMAQCPQCRRERDDLAQQAAILRQPVPAPASSPTAGLMRGLARWWGLPSAGPRLALAGAAMVAVSVLVWSDRPDGGASGPVAESLHSSTWHGASAPGSTGSVTVLRHVTEAQLTDLSPEIGQAYQAKDFARVVRLLQAGVERGSPGAAAALASMTEQGLGVPRDRGEAMRLWESAAAAGDEDAAANLRALSGAR